MTLERNVGFYKEALKGGIDIVCFWKQGKGWDSQVLYTVDEDFDTNTLTPGDADCVAEIKRILTTDPNAIAVNGYFHNLYCGEDFFNRTVVSRRIRELYEAGSLKLADWSIA